MILTGPRYVFVLLRNVQTLARLPQTVCAKRDELKATKVKPVAGRYVASGRRGRTGGCVRLDSSSRKALATRFLLVYAKLPAHLKRQRRAATRASRPGQTRPGLPRRLITFRNCDWWFAQTQSVLCQSRGAAAPTLSVLGAASGIFLLLTVFASSTRFLGCGPLARLFTER